MFGFTTLYQRPDSAVDKESSDNSLVCVVGSLQIKVALSDYQNVVR